MNQRSLLPFFSLIVALLCSSPCFCFYFHQHETPSYASLDPITITEKNSGLELIDCIYVINLDRRPEKLATMMAQCAARGLHPNRVRGVDGIGLTYSLIRKLSGTYPVRMRPGQFGCLLSHLSIYKDAYERGFSRIWILEDDSVMKMDVRLIPSLLSSLTKIDPNWDIFYTDVDSRRPNGEFTVPHGIVGRPDQPRKSAAFFTNRKKVSENIWRIRSRWGTYSYLISRKGLKKLYHYFSHVYLYIPIDADLHFVPEIREYSSTLEIVTTPTVFIPSDTG